MITTAKKVIPSVSLPPCSSELCFPANALQWRVHGDEENLTTERQSRLLDARYHSDTNVLIEVTSLSKCSSRGLSCQEKSFNENRCSPFVQLNLLIEYIKPYLMMQNFCHLQQRERCFLCINRLSSVLSTNRSSINLSSLGKLTF